jgi:uncharacterized protein (DUF433 family)
LQVLNRRDKEPLVIKLHQQGETIREIAAHLSFTDIGSIIRKIDGRDDKTKDVKNKSKDTQAMYLFSTGKKPVDVAIELDVSASEVHSMQEEFWALNQQYELALVYGKIKNILPSFLKLFQSLKEFGMLNEESLSNFLKYAGQDLPELTYRMQQLANEVIDLESKKKQSIDALAQLSDTLSWYHRNIKLNKQILSDLDKKINQKQHVKEVH